MKKILAGEKRAQLEARHKALKNAVAAMEAGKVSGIVDNVSVDNADIQGVVEKIMKIMEAEPDVAKYQTASKKKTNFVKFLKNAFEMLNKEDESPEEEAHDLTDPAMHIFEDAEHEAQTLDDPSLMEEVEKLEEHVKSILNKHKEAPHGEHPVAKMPEAPKHELHGESEAKDGVPTHDSPEHKLAKLKALPKQQRLVKAAKLKALAAELEHEDEVSQNNNMDGDKNDALMNDYKDEEYGSMKDVKAAKKDIKVLLAAMEDMQDEKKKDEDKEDEKVDKKAILKLALQHLYASIEDMEDEDKNKEDEKEDKLDKEANQDLDESEGGKPNWLQDKEEEAEKKEDKSDEKKDESLEEKKARLRDRVRSNMRKVATVDGKHMETPKEVPTAEGTTEDTLKGDTKVQYSSNSGEKGLMYVTPKHEVPSKDEQVAGSVEPNAIYQSNSGGKNLYAPTKEEDSAKEVTNKRVLGDNESAVQKSVPSSPNDAMEKGEGSHSKALEWASEKEKADMTPHGDRLVGLASIIKERTTRASKLVSRMYSAGMIKTESQFAEEIAKYAAYDDNEFKIAESIMSNIGGNVKTSSKHVAAEENMHDHDDDKDEDEKYEEDMKKEARMQRRASARVSDHDGEVRSIKNIAAQNQGLRHPLLLSSDNGDYNPGKSEFSNRVAESLKGLTDPIVVANSSLSILDKQANGEINLESFRRNG